MAQDVSDQAGHALDSSVGRIRDLNERIVEAARRGGEASLQAYERLLYSLAEAQEKGGGRAASLIEAATRAQAGFIREFASASPDALRSVGERVSGLTGAAARQARRVPGEQAVEGQARGVVAREEDLPVAGYDQLTAAQVTSRLERLSRVDRERVEAYERKHKARKTVLAKLDSLTRD